MIDLSLGSIIRDKLQRLELKTRLRPGEEIFLQGKRVHPTTPDFAGYIKPDGFSHNLITLVSEDGLENKIPYKDIYVIEHVLELTMSDEVEAVSTAA